MAQKPKKMKFYKLDAKKHGIGGSTPNPLGVRVPEDKKAKPADFYAVVFFPQYEGVKKTLGKAQVDFWGIEETLANSPEAAKVKFMDGMQQGEKWSTYQKSGHRVRKIRISDLGNAAA